jgi:UPF0042 nucleotide-binding protein
VTDYVMITGLSGAGRTTAADVLEDHGWFVVDNLPVSLIPKVGELNVQPGATVSRVAVVMGSASESEAMVAMVDELRKQGDRVRVLFLDARGEVLIRRYESTRRRHPSGADELLSAAIEQERDRMDVLRAAADVVIDTSDLNVHELRSRVEALFREEGDAPGMQMAVVSFGYKHGLPADVDTVFDCRFLPNPHWVEHLRPQTGQDPAVRDYVLSSELAGPFMDELERVFELLLPAYEEQGKAYLTIAFGCTGGRHRSVAMAEEAARRLEARGFRPRLQHRDVAKPA